MEAAEQCGIISLPEIREPVKLQNIGSILDDDTALVFCDEDENQVSEFGGKSSLSKRKLALLIGPEGGFSPEERALVKSLPNIALLGLGPRILRADTAAVAALAILQATCGDWYQNE